MCCLVLEMFVLVLCSLFEVCCLMVVVWSAVFVGCHALG